MRGWNKGMRNRVERYVMIECGILRERERYILVEVDEERIG